MAFQKSTAWLKQTRLFSDLYNPIWRVLGALLFVGCIVLTLYYSFYGRPG